MSVGERASKDQADQITYKAVVEDCVAVGQSDTEQVVHHAEIVTWNSEYGKSLSQLPIGRTCCIYPLAVSPGTDKVGFGLRWMPNMTNNLFQAPRPTGQIMKLLKEKNEL